MIKIEIPTEAIECHRQKYSNAITQILYSLSDKDNFSKTAKRLKLKPYISTQKGATYFDHLYKLHVDNDILVSPPDKLLELLRKEGDVVCNIFGGDRPKTINCILQKIFDFKAFYRNSDISLRPFASCKESFHKTPSSWGAFKFLQTLEVYVCPYCNADTIFATTVVKNGKKVNIESALDHFFPQSRYPFLALSLYNLVPACSRCNSNIKGARKVSCEELINPYRESFHEAMYFYCEFNSAEAAWGKLEDIRLKVCARDGSAMSKRGAYTADFFSLENIYNTLFLHEASRVMQKKYISQNRAYRAFFESIANETCNIDMNELFWSCSMLDKDINKFRLSKLTIDLIRDDHVIAPLMKN